MSINKNTIGIIGCGNVGYIAINLLKKNFIIHALLEIKENI